MGAPFVWTDEELRTLERIEDRVLWLATYLVHYANHIRPNVDGLKVGGHQASSASVVTLMTALYGVFLRPGDRVAVKAHASPVFHTIQYLRGRLSEEALRRFRTFGGIQAYPSRTKDLDEVDYSTGSMGLGAVAATFGALTRQYLVDHFGVTGERRFVCMVGDAELDEGNVWEAVADEHMRRLRNVLWIVDLNRQSLDRVVPDGTAQRIRDMFQVNGWRVINLKYGTRLRAAFARPGGDRLRHRIDDMPNAEYQALLRVSGAEIRKRLVERSGGTDQAMEHLLGEYGDSEVRDLLRNLGGHDLPAVLEALREADAEDERPVVIVAYTIKGWRLPFEGDPFNHAMLLTPGQIDALRDTLGVGAGVEFEPFPPGSAEWRLLRRELRSPLVVRSIESPGPSEAAEAEDSSVTSTQEAFSRVLSGLARHPIAEHIVTVSPDVATSTHLGGWINRRGVYSQQAMIDYFGRENIARPIRWRESPQGHHIELGISENNLFLLLAALGLAGDLEDYRLIPIGTLYDPFICRGLDALIYALYSGARFILVATPSGVSLAPEGGAHQSSITASIGVEVPGFEYFEPTFASEVEWILLDALERLRTPGPALGVYLRLSTVPIDQRLFPAGRVGLREAALAGGYRIVDRRGEGAYEPEETVVHLFAMGAVVPEAIVASDELKARGIMANVFAISAAGRLYRALATGRRGLRAGKGSGVSPLESLLEPRERRAPAVTVADAHSHALAFIGGALGGRTIALGVDAFGESGTRLDLYRKMGVDRDAIVRAAEAALVELDSDP
ncbi:MAG: 1-deoxy-D-xylulose-5-phosphate synthase N-terminal domain-containing protein [Candidatus Methylomirabilia bacterium]